MNGPFGSFAGVCKTLLRRPGRLGKTAMYDLGRPEEGRELENNRMGRDLSMTDRMPPEGRPAIDDACESKANLFALPNGEEEDKRSAVDPRKLGATIPDGRSNDPFFSKKE